MIAFQLLPIENPYPELDREMDQEMELGKILVEASKFNVIDQAILANYLVYGPVWAKISTNVKSQFPNKLGTSTTGCKTHFDKMVSKLRIHLPSTSWRS
jgi:hypothetical protein